MEGILLVPPEKGTIIGRAVWKPRYVIIGGPHRDRVKSPVTLSQAMTTSRIHASRGSTPKGPPPSIDEAVYLSIYKAKEDWEPIQQNAISSITSCTIQELAHRRQGHVLPTLVINVSPDPTTDKLRKRRSSRTAGLTTHREAAPTTLWFRTADDRYTIYDWARYLLPLIQVQYSGQPPASPVTPASPVFSNPNPFASQREAAGYNQSTGPLSSHPHATLQHKTSSHTYSSRERERHRGYSGPPSLRSKRSDLSSQTSSMNPGLIGFHGSVRSGDLPSPASTIGEYQGEFIEGWTTAQGRSSALSSPTKTHGSFSSLQAQQIGQGSVQTSLISSSPPGPRETILDRAFQLGFIPGSSSDVSSGGGGGGGTGVGGRKLSSIAKFEALACEYDKSRQVEKRGGKESEGLKSVWDLDDSDGEEETQSSHQGPTDVSEADEDEDDDDDGYDGYDGATDDDRFDEERGNSTSVHMPPTAKRALDFITGRRPSQQSIDMRSSGLRRAEAQSSARSTHDRDSAATLSGVAARSRPHTAYGGQWAGLSQRTLSQPHLPANSLSSALLDVPPSSSSERTSEDGRSSTRQSSATRIRAAEKHQSAASVKRLSFTDFTKRLSSTSSLLLVQTNTSVGGSSRGSSEIDPQHLPRGNLLYPRSAPPQPAERDIPEHHDQRCGWRGSVGVFGSEGGFI